MRLSGKNTPSLIQQLLSRVKRWKRVEWGVVLLVVIGFGLRFWNLPNSYQFLGDQGRDAIVVKNLIFHHDPILIGPVTSTGNMYLGPLYYYWMAPFLWLSYPSPMGPVYAIAVLSVLTIIAMYLVGKEIFGKLPALFATFFYTFSWVAVAYGRFSWNPNPAPLVTVLLVWALFRAIRRSPWYWLGVAAGCVVLIQLHYVYLLAIPAVGTFWLWQARQFWQQKATAQVWQKWILSTFLAVGVFLASFLPLVLFDYRHDFLNARNFVAFISESQGQGLSVGQKITTVLKELHGRSMYILFERHFGLPRWSNTLLVLLNLIVLGSLWFEKKRIFNRLSLAILGSFLGWAVLGLSFYRSSVFDHYVAYLWPIVFWNYGVLSYFIFKRSWSKVNGNINIVVAIMGFLVWNVPRYPLKSLSWPAARVKETAATLFDHMSADEKYNLVLLTGTGDIEGQNYRYFLETTDHPPLPRERWGEADTLFIINDDHVLKKVTDSPIYEIVVFPNKEPAEVYTIPNGPEITVLRRK